MTTQFRINPQVRTTAADEDGSVLINLQSGIVFSLNSIAAKIWTLMEEGTSFEGIIESLAQEYETPRQQLQKDLNTLIGELQLKGLMRTTAT